MQSSKYVTGNPFAGNTAVAPAALCLFLLWLLSACSGIETVPGDTSIFAAKKFSRYAWRTDALSTPTGRVDKLHQADPIVRAAVEERMAELGYQQVAKDDAEFLIEYLAAAGMNAGQLPRNSNNVMPYPTATINRLPDGASMDNAYALSGAVETGNLLLVFVDAKTIAPLWDVRISSVIENANRVNEKALRSAVLHGLRTVPASP